MIATALRSHPIPLTNARLLGANPLFRLRQGVKPAKLAACSLLRAEAASPSPYSLM